MNDLTIFCKNGRHKGPLYPNFGTLQPSRLGPKLQLARLKAAASMIYKVKPATDSGQPAI